MTGPGVVNIYYQACFLLLFLVHEYNAICWHGNTGTGDMSGQALIRTDHVYCIVVLART